MGKFGVTPALNCTMWNAVYVGAINTVPSFKKPIEANEIKMPIGPGGLINSRPMDITIQELTWAFDKQRRILIYGAIEYREVFSSESDIPRFTEFCFDVIVERDPRLIDWTSKVTIPDIIRFDGISEHNSSS